jgi:two-component system, LytTR family, response regulator
MIKVMIVDDEIPAIEELIVHLSDIDHIEIVNTFCNSITANSCIIKEKPDLVFLDINMPGVNGLELALNIMNNSTKTNVVFITAYDKYAIEAFELNAIDYILKPFRKERLHRTIEKVLKTIDESKEFDNSSSTIPYVKLFGGVEVIASNSSIKWNTIKVKEIFAYLLLNRSVKISRDILIDTIFPQVDNDRAKKYLNTCIYLIRKNIKEYNLEEFFNLDLHNNNYTFSAMNIKIDFEDFKAKANEANKNNNLKLMKQALNMYDDNFLKDIDSIWAIEEQENVELFYDSQLESFVGALIQRGGYNEAEEFLKDELEKRPTNYALNLQMSRLLEKMGQWRKAKRYLKRCYDDL